MHTDASRRVINALGKAGIHDLWELCRLSPSELEAVPNLGAKSIAELHDILNGHAMRLAEEDPTRSTRASRQPKEDARLEEMVARRLAGETLDEIGRAYGVTRERVRQILRAGPSMGQLKTNRAEQDRGAANGRRDDIIAAFRRGDTPQQIALVYGLKEQSVAGLIHAEASDLDRAARRAAHDRTVDQRYTDDDLIAAIREVAERYGRAPSSGEYAKASSGGMLPSLPTIHNRLGWANAVELAGYAPRGKRRAYKRRWTEDACRAALIKLVVESAHVPTVHEYEQLSQLDPDLPSVGTLRQRIGTWSRVTGYLVRIPTLADVLERLDAVGAADVTGDGEVWMAYLDEHLSDIDLVVLSIADRFHWSSDFGEPPPILVPLFPDDPEPEG